MPLVTCGADGSTNAEVVEQINSNTTENVFNVDSMTDILGIDFTIYKTVNIRGYYNPNDGGGGLFNWDSTIDKSTADGGIVLDPSVSLPLQGTGIGLGCWVRQYNGQVKPEWFGYGLSEIPKECSTDGFGTTYYNPTSNTLLKTILAGSVTPTNGHRHFGSIIKTLDGRMIIFYRRSPEHGVVANTTINMVYSDDNGVTWSSENVLIVADATYDNREVYAGLNSQSGTISVVFNRVTADSSGNNLFQSMQSFDNGATWTTPTTFATQIETYSRLFGQMKEVPSDNANYVRMLIAPAYYKDNSTGLFTTSYYKSYDEGKTWGNEQIIQSSATGFSETAVTYISEQSVIAISRSSSGLNMFVSLDGGSTWLDRGVIPLTSSDSYVAPSLNEFIQDGVQYLLLGYCDRALNKTTWRIDTASNAFNATPGSLFGSTIQIGDADMINASGYQSAYISDNGTMTYVEFKEYVTPGDPYSDIRYGVGYIGQWIGRRELNYVSYGMERSVTKPSYINAFVRDSDRPAIATDSASTNRVHWAVMQSDAFKGGIGLSTDGNVALFDNAGTERMYYQTVGAKMYIPNGLNVGDNAEVERTGFVNNIAPSSSIPAFTTWVGTDSAITHYEFRNPNGKVGSITTSGTATAYNTSSDPRLKSEFENLSDAEIEKVINDIAYCTGRFNFLSTPDVKVVGFNAHKILDIQGLGSEIGTEGLGGRYLSIDDVDGVDEDEKPLKVSPASVDQSKAVPYLVLAVNRLLKRVQELESKL